MLFISGEKKGTKSKNNHLTPTIKYDGGSLMHGAVASGALVNTDGIMNSAKKQEILAQKPLPGD